MAEITAEIVNKLRQKTNAGMMDCKKALTEAQGDLEAAETILRKKGITKAAGKQDRATKEGIIASYIHLAGRVGVLIEVNCETDFVAKNENFQSFVKDLTLHIAAANPTYLQKDDVPADIIAKEKEIAAEQVKGKPANVVEKIVEGKISKIFSEQCLLDQAYIKDDKLTISDLIKSKIAELGENIVVRRFTRYAVGGE
ncbi:translation elongation factor Ts (EF-Ts) [Roseimicrobium gellanilyticum]|uniref:Elongation factor Ts n=1 Tax=Roseimicrobium gellanilyticum TaxID=748857 RepID=A0A366HEH0_9BACT|nr:translation elongation factor Ts [Roseimicrobium gellanilyticum]RBP39708.1 translation elongation factor Ts (EF-Ts) [Roseimicrobium gellanilyticum]